MKLPLPLIAIMFCAAHCTAMPRAAVAASSQQAGTATSAGNAAGEHAAPAAQAAARRQARAAEATIAAANARAGRLANQKRAAVLQRNRQAQQYAAQTLNRAHSRLLQSPSATAGVTMARFTTAGSLRAPPAGQDLSARGVRGVTISSQPGLRITQPGTAATIAPNSRVAVVRGKIGGPRLPLSGRLGGPAVGPAAGNAAIDGSQMRRRF